MVSGLARAGTGLGMQTTSGLRAVQEESVRRLYSSMIRSGWSKDRMSLGEGQTIIHVENGKSKILYHQILADARIRLRFKTHRKRLPRNCRVHQLPLRRIGALADMNLDAFVGFANREADDFIAISYGTFKLRLWGIVTANANGAEIGPQPPVALGATQTEEWWQSSILALAADLHGNPWDNDRVSTITEWDRKAGNVGGWDDVTWALLEGFIVYHEIAHYELGHIDRLRSLAHAGRAPSLREKYAMEWEADQFAWNQVRDRAPDEDTALTALAVIFALLALHPDLLQQYPLCPDGPSHPHPLTRFSWLMKKIRPDVVDRYEYIWLALSFVRYALESIGAKNPSIIEVQISNCMDRKVEPPSM
jgi:hypothetical protein